jgi:hypothetical protein
MMKSAAQASPQAGTWMCLSYGSPNGMMQKLCIAVAVMLTFALSLTVHGSRVSVQDENANNDLTRR